MKKYNLLRVIQERDKAFWVSIQDPISEEVFSSVWLPKKGCIINELEETIQVDKWVIDGNPHLNPVQDSINEAMEYFESAINNLKYGLEILEQVRICIKR